ncbi:gamma-glutamylcyclotransferase family protein [Vibrio panuliri]|uniref:Gamma-glutamylcyclotransferase family protein n=1 Tax=Vibrio panuliri TaxID=1381081 RepID=A0A1Q9HGR8_9VIBR|nr:gamma-glutamylcyclotransferase [Vibrio panuliri]KAB1459644.1 gamma-glutamylcyclotransferase [Vibrio panuliri]OLQ86201.1 gamma-glutamylcyclotransferase [Vibrio panuliri]OLQ89150.1 gamma-glutamylcyclotransferase [Vibrio panuliri]
MQHLVFVYGTLRQGESNHHYLANAQLLGLHETAPNYALYDLGAYPAVISGHQAIFGEVYLVDEVMLQALDQLEDVPVEYRRELIDTPFGQAWIYLYQDASLLDVIISSGDWSQRV